MTAIFPALLLLGQAVLANEKPAACTIPPSYANVRYGPDQRNTLDLWCARSEKPTPLVIFIHGGGWAGGDKTSVTDRFLRTMLSRGISVASVNYRLAPQNILPVPVHDAARAVQFLRIKAGKWNLDPSRFGAFGISAGGCTALWLATHDDLADLTNADPVLRESTRLSAAAGISAQTTLDPDVAMAWVGPMVMNHGMLRRAVGVRTLEEIQAEPQLLALLREFSPLNHLGRDDPPVLLSYPAMGPVPAPTAGAAIHHANFGIKFKERADAVGANCHLRIDSEAGPGAPTAEEFLLEKLGAAAR